MAARRCPHCGLVNPARSMECDCGYSFVDGSPPRFTHDKPKLGGADFESRLMTRVVVRGGIVVLGLLVVVATRGCY